MLFATFEVRYFPAGLANSRPTIWFVIFMVVHFPAIVFLWSAISGPANIASLPRQPRTNSIGGKFQHKNSRQ